LAHASAHAQSGLALRRLLSGPVPVFPPRPRVIP
jgi:hypothetical protein